MNPDLTSERLQKVAHCVIIITISIIGAIWGTSGMILSVFTVSAFVIICTPFYSTKSVLAILLLENRNIEPTTAPEEE